MEATSSMEATRGSDENFPLWRYITKLGKASEGGGNAKFTCNYCHGSYSGSYSRVKAHLLRIRNAGIKACPKVTDENIFEMTKMEEEAEKRKNPKLVPLASIPSSHGSSATGANVSSVALGKRRKETPLERAWNKEDRDTLTSSIARMFYSGGLPFHFARNPHYVDSFKFAAERNLPGYLPPGYNSLRTSLLQKERAHIERLLKPMKATWNEKGVSIVSDGWSDAQRRPLINFMATSETGPIFLKAIDGTREYKDKFYISGLIKDVISEVGPLNVVQVITDNAAVMKAAGKIVQESYPHIFWTPCVVHTLNLALKNICAAKNTEKNANIFEECQWITQVADDASFIRTFIMNHSMRLAIFNECSPLKLLAVADTRFASTIVMLKRLFQIKGNLQRMVVSDDWSSYREDDVRKAQSVKELVLNDVWWDRVEYILEFTNPIYEMLRCADTDKPILHMVYDMWDTMIVNVKKAIFRHEGLEENDRSSFYDVVHAILIDRCTKSSTPLHCLAHSLNPNEQWINEVPNRVAPHRDEEISMERNKCFKQYFDDIQERLKVNTEYARFSGCMDSFGASDCLEDRWMLDPKVWWYTYGSSLPLLQTLAFKLLGQPCSSSCAERNWSTYSFIHSLKRNKILPTRAEDLVYVHSNLRLLSRKTDEYGKGGTMMWDIAGDTWDEPFGGAGVLEIASLSLDEPYLESVTFNDGEVDMAAYVDVL